MIEHRNIPTAFHIQLDAAEVIELLWLMNRAVNSLQPEKWPTITQTLINHLEKYVERSKQDPSGGNPLQNGG